MWSTVTGFHVEPTNICTLKCSGCPRTRFIKQWPQHWRNHSLDVDALLNFLDIDLRGKKIALIGNYGDPIYHPEFLEFVAKIKQTGAEILITTNGSYRTKSWWQELTRLLDHKDTVRFSIDGLPDNFTQYRVNADWPTILEGIETCVASDCKTIWKYIPFAFNQHSIDAAKLLSQKLGIDEFVVECSDRYDEETANLLPQTQTLIGAKYQSKLEWHQKPTGQIQPHCDLGQSHYISADGFYTPCCFTADHRFYYKNEFGKNKKDYDITKQTFSELLSRPKVIEFYNTLDQQPVCHFNCPKV